MSDFALDCTDPALRQIIQYVALKWGPIAPCDGKTWEESVTTVNGEDILWFNTPDGSTRIHKLSRRR